MKGFERPEFTVLSESNAIPEGHLVGAPASYTHELTRDAPYWYERGAGTPNGTLAAGTKVALVGEEDGRCRVIDPRGLDVTIESGSLRKL